MKTKNKINNNEEVLSVNHPKLYNSKYSLFVSIKDLIFHKKLF